MGTVANVKNGSMVQLEFQAIGTSETTIMLQQPLLGTTTDGFTVEVTQLMMSLGNERAMSGNEFLLAVFERPTAPNTEINLDSYHTRINAGQSEPDAMMAIIDATAGNTYTDPDRVNAISNRNCYSAIDFLYMVNHEILRTDLAPNDVHLGISASGQLQFSGTSDFWRDYMLVVGPILKALSGCGDIIYASGIKVKTSHSGKVTVPAFTAEVPTRPRAFHGKINESMWEIFDRRKRIRVDLTIPVGLTLGWQNDHEVQKYSVQEFYLPKGEPQAHRENDMNVTNTMTISQLQLVGTTEFVDGGGKLAIKRLFPGPVQALRLSLILIYERFDSVNKVWIEKEKPVDMSAGDFFYLKLLFNKETT